MIGRDEADARRQVEARGLYVSAIAPVRGGLGLRGGKARGKGRNTRPLHFPVRTQRVITPKSRWRPRPLSIGMCLMQTAETLRQLGGLPLLPAHAPRPAPVLSCRDQGTSRAQLA
ncbi:hypothetical protein KVP70_33250, partial [Duganella sp. HSC-15S17]|nr:hypothetical protein [Duganella violaceicalia]